MVRVEIGKEIEGLPHFDLFRQIGGLQADADAIFERLALLAGIVAQDRDLAAVAGAEPFQHFHGGGLPGPVRTKEGEDFSRVHFEVDSPYGRKTAVVLRESAYLNWRAARHRVDDDVTA
jgi:hypothetical protein